LPRRYPELRYFYTVLVPLALLCSAGLDRLARVWGSGSPVV
jgi:hypothetical protein